MFKNFNDILEELRQSYNRLLNENHELRDRLSRYDSNKEIDELKQKLLNCQTHAITILTDREQQEAKEFIAEHHDKCKITSWNYEISTTGFSASIVIKCPKCGESKNITDRGSF